MTDDQLLSILKTGQQDALEQMMNKYHRYVHSIIAVIISGTGGPEDIEEPLQDTFYSVWTHADSIYSGKLKSYLGTTARNKAKSWLRGRKDLPMALDAVEIPDPRSSLEDVAVQKELGRQLRRAIQKCVPRIERSSCGTTFSCRLPRKSLCRWICPSIRYFLGWHEGV